MTLGPGRKEQFGLKMQHVDIQAHIPMPFSNFLLVKFLFLLKN